MPNNNLTTLEQHIYNSIPKLRELSSGCEIEIEKTKYTVIGERALFIDCLSENYRVEHYLKSDSEITTIGHPILLNDVLEWMKGFKKQNLELAYGFNLRGEFWDVDAYYMCEWDLSKPLKDQSQELIDALCDLIPK